MSDRQHNYPVTEMSAFRALHIYQCLDHARAKLVSVRRAMTEAAAQIDRDGSESDALRDAHQSTDAAMAVLNDAAQAWERVYRLRAHTLDADTGS